MNYIKLNSDDAAAVKRMSELATKILREHYDPIVGKTQNDYMLDMFQSVKAIEEQLKHGYQYYFVVDSDGKNAGFLAFYPKEDEMYLSKLYLLKEMRGQGISRDMLNFLIEKTKAAGFSSISLNVNKKNGSVEIYERLGFKRVGKEKNDIGNGYFMDDFVYRYTID